LHSQVEQRLLAVGEKVTVFVGVAFECDIAITESVKQFSK
jgi:hypothetical protein